MIEGSQEILLEEKTGEKSRQLALYDAPVASLQFFVLNIIFNEEKILPWFFSNYIQLEWLDNWCITFSILQDYYVGYPFIDKQILIRDTIDHVRIDIADFLISNIDQGWYTHLCFDEYYIPGKGSYQKKHHPHDNMICGYDKENQLFTLFGYADTGKLEVTQATFHEIRTGYQELGAMLDPDVAGTMQYYNLIFMIKKNLSHHYVLDIAYVKQSLRNFLSGGVYAEHFRMIKNIHTNKSYGVNIYNKLMDEIQLRNHETLRDVRLLTTIYEHKKIMTMRIQYFMESKVMAYDAEFIQEFVEIEGMALDIRNLQLYYTLRKNENTLKRMCDHLTQMQIRERTAIERLIKEI